MPPTKQATSKKTPAKRAPAKKTAKKAAAQKAAKRSGPRKMSAAHKRALAEGRQSAAIVDRYLAALHVPKPRGRKVSLATLQQRLATAEADIKKTMGTARLFAAQQARDLRARIDALGKTAAADIKKLEADFVRVAKRFSERRGIGYGAWRDAGVPAQTLQRAGVKRTRG